MLASQLDLSREIIRYRRSTLDRGAGRCFLMSLDFTTALVNYCPTAALQDFFVHNLKLEFSCAPSDFARRVCDQGGAAPHPERSGWSRWRTGCTSSPQKTQLPRLTPNSASCVAKTAISCGRIASLSCPCRESQGIRDKLAAASCTGKGCKARIECPADWILERPDVQQTYSVRPRGCHT